MLHISPRCGSPARQTCRRRARRLHQGQAGRREAAPSPELSWEVWSKWSALVLTQARVCPATCTPKPLTSNSQTELQTCSE